jgi:hypothetical protein
MSNRSIGLYRYQQWRERHRSPKASPVRRIDPQTGKLIAILPASGKPKVAVCRPVRRRRIVWRRDDVVMRVLDELRKPDQRLLEGERR